MTVALTLLSRAADDADAARDVVAALDLERQPHHTQDAAELSMFRTLAPILREHGGNRDAVWRACPQSLRYALLFALSLPDWWHRRCEPLPVLLAQWNAGRTRDWELPNRADPIAPPPAAPRTLAPRRVPLTLHALPVWQKRQRLQGNRAPFLDPLHRAAILEVQARDAERVGDWRQQIEWMDKLKALRDATEAQHRRTERAELRRSALHTTGARDDAA